MNITNEYQNIYANRKFKDSLFRMVFNAREDLLDLYNAIFLAVHCRRFQLRNILCFIMG